MTEQDINRAAQKPQIIRNHRKISEAVFGGLGTKPGLSQ
jgi:3-methyladenine DNA glycosylase Tag